MKDWLGAFYPESQFGGFADIDGTIAFYLRVHSLTTPSSVLLDFGCGCGAYANDPIPIRRQLRIFRSKVARVIGLDVDQAGRFNPFIDEFRPVVVGQPRPAEGKSVDIMISDSVMEHLPDPEFFFSESKRVLRPGGYLCIRTTNLLSYVGIIARLIPNLYHRLILRIAQPGRKEEDIFPTLYRCNTVFQLRKWMRKYGFDHVCYGYEAAPSYLNFSKILYALGVLHQKYAPGFIKPTIFAYGRSNSQ